MDIAVHPKVKITALGPAIDKLSALRERKRELEAQIKEIEDDYSRWEEALLDKLKSDGVDKATGKTATASITKSVVADVQDWEAFHKFIKRTGYFHLLQKRVSEPAYRELLETKGTPPPGTQPFTKTKLYLRSL